MNKSSVHHPLIACHECDQLQHLPQLSGSACVRCVRCGYVLLRGGADPVSAPLALGITAAILLAMSFLFPLLDFRIQGQLEVTYLLDGILELMQQGQVLLGLLVLFTTFLVPLAQIALLIHVFLPLALGRRPYAFDLALRLIQGLLPWSMLEIFLLGILVATVKLAEQATIVPGIGAWSLGALVIVLAAASTRVHPRRLWERVA